MVTLTDNLKTRFLSRTVARSLPGIRGLLVYSMIRQTKDCLNPILAQHVIVQTLCKNEEV